MRDSEFCGQQLDLKSSRFPLSLSRMNIFHRPVLINMKLARNAEIILFPQSNYAKRIDFLLQFTQLYFRMDTFAGRMRNAEVA